MRLAVAVGLMILIGFVGSAVSNHPPLGVLVSEGALFDLETAKITRATLSFRSCEGFTTLVIALDTENGPEVRHLEVYLDIFGPTPPGGCFSDPGATAFTLTDANGDASLIGLHQSTHFVITTEIEGSLFGQYSAFVLLRA